MAAERAAVEAQAGRQDEASVIIVHAPAEAPATATIPLPELLHAVNQLGGRLCNRNGQVVVDGVPGNLPPGVAEAIAMHSDTLRGLLPVAQAEAINEEAFFVELRALANAEAEPDPWPELDQCGPMA